MLVRGELLQVAVVEVCVTEERQGGGAAAGGGGAGGGVSAAVLQGQLLEQNIREQHDLEGDLILVISALISSYHHVQYS